MRLQGIQSLARVTQLGSMRMANQTCAVQDRPLTTVPLAPCPSSQGRGAQQPLRAVRDDPRDHSLALGRAWRWPSRGASPFSAVQGMRGRWPWPSCRRPPLTVACISAPSATSTAPPLPTSASVPRVSVPPPGLPAQPGSEGGCSVQAGQPEGSCFLFLFSAQCCRDSSQEKKAKV